MSEGGESQPNPDESGDRPIVRTFSSEHKGPATEMAAAMVDAFVGKPFEEQQALLSDWPKGRQQMFLSQLPPNESDGYLGHFPEAEREAFHEEASKQRIQ